MKKKRRKKRRRRRRRFRNDKHNKFSLIFNFIVYKNTSKLYKSNEMNAIVIKATQKF